VHWLEPETTPIVRIFRVGFFCEIAVPLEHLFVQSSDFGRSRYTGIVRRGSRRDRLLDHYWYALRPSARIDTVFFRRRHLQPSVQGPQFADKSLDSSVIVRFRSGNFHRTSTI